MPFHILLLLIYFLEIEINAPVRALSLACTIKILFKNLLNFSWRLARDVKNGRQQKGQKPC
jgi:hypothetical protein